MQHPIPPPQPNVPGVAPPASLLLAALPNELRLQIAGELSEWRDRAALCLACPPLGMAAIREIDEYKDPLLAIAIALWQRGAASTVLNEPLFRRYAADDRASEDGCGWLTDAAERHGVDIGFEIARHQGRSLWSLTHMGARLRLEFSDGMVFHCEGEQGAERVVRGEFSDGKAEHYEGEQGAERAVRTEFSDGMVEYYEGENGAERIVRLELPNGHVWHYEGDQGAERAVRGEFLDGKVFHYEGESGAERVVRAEVSDGTVQYYEGEQGAERMVRGEYSDGKVQHYEDEKGAERMVRAEFSDGMVQHYEGGQGAEQVVRLELPNGKVLLRTRPLVRGRQHV